MSTKTIKLKSGDLAIFALGSHRASIRALVEVIDGNIMITGAEIVGLRRDPRERLAKFEARAQEWLAQHGEVVS